MCPFACYCLGSIGGEMCLLQCPPVPGTGSRMQHRGKRRIHPTWSSSHCYFGCHSVCKELRRSGWSERNWRRECSSSDRFSAGVWAGSCWSHARELHTPEGLTSTANVFHGNICILLFCCDSPCCSCEICCFTAGESSSPQPPLLHPRWERGVLRSVSPTLLVALWSSRSLVLSACEEL